VSFNCLIYLLDITGCKVQDKCITNAYKYMA